MAARTFTDSEGQVWEAFEVHRASQNPGAVSPGLELGWLAFASGTTKRRLAPFPPDWALFPDEELATLCDAARQAPTPRYPINQPLRPRICRTAPHGLEPPGDSGADGVQGVVRNFARDARARGLAAVAAMLELKTLLQERYPEAESEARDRKLVRQWFVDAYYFNRDG